MGLPITGQVSEDLLTGLWMLRPSRLSIIIFAPLHSILVRNGYGTRMVDSTDLTTRQAS